MICELPYRRMLILTEGQLGVFTSKTGVSVLRYRRGDCVGVLDSAYANQPIEALLPDTGITNLPIFGSVADALVVKPDAILIGIAPAGGALPPAMRRHLVDALKQGIAIISGLHTMLRDDPELVELAKTHQAKLHDVRDPGPMGRVSRGHARRSKAKRVLTVGTDCNVGKMVAALELRKAAVAAGIDAAFAATGQTGIMIEGWGLPIDHILSDFTGGAVEMLVEHVADRQLCIIEGQGSVVHPGYSGVTLSLLHGSCPDAMIMVTRPDRAYFSGWTECPITPLAQQLPLYEQILAPLHPGKVVAVAVNTAGMAPEAAEQAIAAIERETGLPAADPIRNGCAKLLAALRKHLEI